MWYSERRRGRRSSDSIGLACGPGTGIAVRADGTYRPYNIWRQQVKTTGFKHFGNSEVRWVDNLLYLYTQPFDVVAEGLVRAETIRQAVALVGHPEVNIYPLPADAVWPGEPGEAVWRCGYSGNVG